MATAESFEFNSDGKVTVTAVEELPTVKPTFQPAQDETEDEEGIELITRMIADPDSAIADITRLIALEIAKVMKKMTGSADPLERGTYSMRELTEQVKAFRELQKTLTEAETLSKKDVLNLDGPKFKFVFTEIIGWFRKALKDAGVEADLAQNIMLQFGDLAKGSDETLRRELNKIESGR